MRSTSLAYAFAALSSSALVAAQTFSDCDPTKGDKCNPDPAFGNCRKTTSFDFSTVAGGEGWKTDKTFLDFWTPEKGIVGDNSPLTIDEHGAVLTISNKDQAPLIKSNKYLFFGKVDVTVKAAPGVGIVTSVVLESDDRDEIDWEWIGGEPGNVQTNFFSKGVNNYIHGQTHGVAFNAIEGLHTYTIDWTPDYISFQVDGAEIRRATPAEADNGATWPQTPVQVKLGTWVGGKPDNPQGTIDWAGGLADFAQAPFIAWYKEVKITDYCGGKDQAGEYVYTDSSGSQGSIEVRGSSSDVGFGDDKGKSSTSTSTTSSSSPTSSSASKPSSSSTSSSSSSSSSSSNSTSATGGGSTPTDGADGGSSNNGSDQDGNGQGSGAVAARLSSTLAAVVVLGYVLFS
ncbi:hypothetical protein SAPIO_CDS4442 [Scedosporium apiospermum]|uniref:Crh-like protein n=1 Tax=Pseudallescheria apiosperma TaxID=563466 RepID=A0A084G872_PSEDA|nr:uncharacterized protein SAPIO_CDS4442 [Scedosporium apiospermum]KEZ43534.1 hypothetical protein SAPIO_CDS4442 [Scedosporium apiospermum]